MKILLISANTLTVPYPVYPLGLDYVADSIPDGHETRILDMNSVKTTGALAGAVRAFAPDIVGLSLRNIDNTDTMDSKSFMDGYKEIMRAVRTNSAAPVVLGGSGFTIFPEELLELLEADYGIIGEGERFGLLIRALEKGADPGTVPGLIMRGSGALIPEPWEGSFSRRFDPDGGYLSFYLKRSGMLNLQTKRGCTFKCIYCTYPHIEGHSLRLIQPAEVARTARALQDAGARYIFITDSAFNSSVRHSLDVAGAFIKAGVSVPWGAFLVPASIPEDYFKALRDAGLAHAEFGTESLCGEMLSAYRKPFGVEDVFSAHRAALDSGIHVAHYLMLGGPGENRETLSVTLDNAQRLEKTALFFFCGVRIYPHTELYEIALKEGMLPDRGGLLEPVFYHSPHISKDEIFKAVEESRQGRPNWVVGSLGDKMVKMMRHMYNQGYYGPLWEYLIQ